MLMDAVAPTPLDKFYRRAFPFSDVARGPTGSLTSSLSVEFDLA